MPLQQADILGGTGYDHLGVYSEDYGSLVQIGPSNEEKKIKIIPEESYAQYSDGTKLRVDVEPHEFDVRQGYPYIRDRLWVLDEKGRRKKKIENGDWRFLITFADKDGRKGTREFKASYWTFHYIPVIHGPPN